MDGVVRPKRYEVTGDEAIEVSVCDSHANEASESQKVPVVWEDDDLLVVDKPAGMVVHPGAGVRGGTLVEALEGRIAGGDDPDRPGVVHRLDRDTSGLLVFARTQEAYLALTGQMLRREIEREYVALVKGRPTAMEGIIDAPLGRDRRRRTRMSSDTDTPREAITRFFIEEQFADSTLLRILLETGRTHQIRAHLRAIKLPVIGDRDYGVPDELGRQFLHARRLKVGELEWRSPLPDDLAATLEQHRNPTPDA